MYIITYMQVITQSTYNITIQMYMYISVHQVQSLIWSETYNSHFLFTGIVDPDNNDIRTV